MNLADLIPEITIQRGGIQFPKFVLDANGLPIAIKNGNGLMLRLVEKHGYGGRFEGHAAHVHPSVGLTSIHIAGVLHVGDKYRSVALGHMESGHAVTGVLAETGVFMDNAQRRKPKSGKLVYGSGLFTLQLFRPATV